MPRSKTVTPQTIIGEKGISLITQRCLEMGFLFHPRRVDHGIDGHIDLVDPATGALLNTTVLVQSKAQNRPFTAETDDGFSYVCDERDLDLWLSGNAPVLLVLSHPDDRQAWWVEVKSAFPDAAMAEEFLALTKMNWNQTRLDGRLPVTIRTANQVQFRSVGDVR